MMGGQTAGRGWCLAVVSLLALGSHACSGPCQDLLDELRKKGQLSAATEDESLRQVLSQGWRDSFPFGACPGSVPTSDQECQTTFSTSTFLSGLRLPCPKAPTMAAYPVPGTLQNTRATSFNLHVGVGIRVAFTATGNRTFSGCAHLITHDHDGSGTTGTKQCPPDYIHRFVVGTVGIKLTLHGEGSYSQGEKAGTITAGSTCAFTKQHEFRGCSYLGDGAACNTATPPDQVDQFKKLVGEKLVPWYPRGKDVGNEVGTPVPD